MLTDEQHLKNIIIKAEQLDLIIPWLYNNLTGQQQKEIAVISDPLSRRILTYLASDEK